MTDTTGRTYIALGTNLPLEGLFGAALLSQALESIAGAGVKVCLRSSPWRSPPWPAELKDQPHFVNEVAEIDPGALTAPDLFTVLAGVEIAFGRERQVRWGARTLDLDLLDYKGFVGRAGALTLPHPRLAERAFVLAPLAEIAPIWRHPALGLSAAALLQRLGDQGVERLEPDAG